ncbi:TPA: glycosyltransferase [Escherichia coli]|nr:glycosyltransferase [Escherichia coli]
MGDYVTPEILDNMIRQYFSQERPEEETIQALNHLRRVLHEVTPFAQEPVDCVLWVKADEVVVNDYNPNVMAPAEKKLLKHSLEQDGCERAIRFIPPGFAFERLYQEFALPLPAHVQHWLNARDGVPVIVQAGMLRPEKGHDFMLDILSKLKLEGYRFRWLIAGAGRPEEEEKLRTEIVRKGMEGNVLMCGKLVPLAPVWRAASLMVMPSRKKPFGMVVVEASASGVPVIASDVGAFRT